MKQTSGKTIAGNLYGASYLVKWTSFLLALSLLVVCQVASAATTAAVAPDTVTVDSVLTGQDFDHNKTGFLLTGAHYTARCATCHINGVLKGIPRDCSACHVVGNRMAATAKPINHILTNAQCDICHKTNLWIPALFSHVGIVEGTCTTCHNGSTSTGKPRNHLLTSTSCDGCHKTLDWLQVVFSHKNITSGCGDCHSEGSQQVPGMHPVTKPANHMDTMGQDCGTCHYTTSFVSLKSGIPLPQNHIPTTRPCATCHNPSGFLPAIMSHSGIFTGCADCHNGQNYAGATPLPKPNNHYPTNLVANGSACETCHSASQTNSGGFVGAPMNHIGITGSCSTCHLGTPAYANTTPIKTKADFTGHISTASDCSRCHLSTSDFSGASPTEIPANHLPTTKTCITCHASGYGTNSGVMGTAGHVGLTSCIICHGDSNSFLGGPFKTKADAVPTHIDTAADCSTCHLPSSFATGGFRGASGGTTLPANHIPTTTSCAVCHTTGFGAGSGLTAGGNMIHTGIVTGCASCHNGTSYFGVKPLPKPNNHYPTTSVTNGSVCETCHSTSRTSIGQFAGASMVHTGITGNCNACHLGTPAYANTTPIKTKADYTGHVSTASDCSKCHDPSKFTSFAGGVSEEMPANHVPTALTCTICHTSGFGAGSGLKSNGEMVHTGIATGCVSCHSGATFYGPVKPVSKLDFPTHPSTALDCYNCHDANKTTIGGFAGATGGVLPANHVPTSQSCSLCHATGTGPNSGKMNHIGIANNCASCHSGAPGTPYLGVTPTPKPSNHVPTGAVTNGSACETCHSTSNFTSFAGTAMKHTGITSGCATCHSGAVFAGGAPVSKPSNHVPTTLTTNGSACETCHSKTVFTSFAGSGMSHAGISSNCAVCHNGQTFAGGTPTTKSSRHIPYATGLLNGGNMQCETCHSKTNFTSFTSGVATGATLHNNSQGSGSGLCVTCHLSGTNFTGGMQKKSHEGASANKDCSKSSCHRPLGNRGTSYSRWD